MREFDDIEKEPYYKDLKILLRSTKLSKVEQILFLSSFEGWYHFSESNVYKNLVKVAVSTLEMTNEEL